jgi:hypothetical protein
MVSVDPGDDLIAPVGNTGDNHLWLFNPDDPDAPGILSSPVVSVGTADPGVTGRWGSVRG